MRQTVRTLCRFRHITDSMNVKCVDVIATEAVRRAENGAELVRAINTHTGLQVQILSGDAEAHYSALGVISSFDKPHGLVGDLGGGSLELAEVHGDCVSEKKLSLPLGTLPVNARIAKYGTGAGARIDETLRNALPSFSANSAFYAVGGSWRALAKISIAMSNRPFATVHGYELDTQQGTALVKAISKMSTAQIRTLPGIRAKRADALPAAMLVLEKLTMRLRPRRIVFCAFGLREGWLYAHHSAWASERAPMAEGTPTMAAPQTNHSGLDVEPSRQDRNLAAV